MVLSSLYGGYSRIKGLDKLDPFYIFQQSLMVSSVVNINSEIFFGYVYDIDNDTFGVKNAYGSNIEKITGYFIENNFFKNEITFPANKKDNDLYLAKDKVYVFVKKNPNKTYIKLLKDKDNYVIFNDTMIIRLEKFLNILLDMKIAPIAGDVSIDENKITISNSDESRTFEVDTDYLVVKESDSVDRGDYITKCLSIEIDEGVYKIRSRKNINSYIGRFIPAPYKIIYEE